MNKLVITSSLIASLIGIPGIPQQEARANDEVWAAIGGFVGGVVVGSALSDHRDDHRYDHHQPAYLPPPSRHLRPVVIEGHGHGRHAPGQWAWIQVRVWIPGTHEIRRDHCGQRVRVYLPGRYEVRRERRWVAYESRRGSGRHRG